MEYTFISCDYFCFTVCNFPQKNSYQSKSLGMIQLFHNIFTSIICFHSFLVCGHNFTVSYRVAF